ncbi:MAG TPA: amidohydrolase, partial [Gemmatimonadaceae bacterium]|nr:amidohydrolase [Gemmatimonadaceae bacterium]
LAMREVASNGVTAVHHMGTWQDLETFDRFHAAGRLRTRVHAAVPISTWARLRDTVAECGVGDEWLRIGSLKGFVDGSLGSHTAAMLEPYRDAPSDSGLLMHPEGQLEEWIAGADRAGLQVVMHAIGDRANRLQLDLFERVARENGPRDRRFRIEHAQHLTGVDIPRFSTVGVIASAQPFHAIDDARWAERLIGPSRARFAYAFRSLLDARARLAFGSDWPVAPPTPIEGIFAAVTRRPPDGSWPDGWVPEQRITVWEALTAYTFGAAHACFREADLGTLERGKRADLVMLDRDLTTIPTETLRDARVRLTVVGGEIVYRDAC